MKSSSKTVLITGGNGFIGANLARKLLTLGYNVNLLTHNTDFSRLKGTEDKISIHRLDIRDKALTDLIIKISPSYIFHLATYSSYRNQSDVKEMADIAINGTLNLLLATRNIPYQLFVNTGSSSEYGFKNKPMKETDLLEPISFYAAMKAGQTHLCNTFSFQYDKPIVTIRPFSVYGPYEKEDRFIPTVIRSLILGESIKLTEGNQRRDFIYVDDLINIYTTALDKGMKLKGNILNAGSGKEYTNDEVVDILFKIAGKKVSIEKGKFPKRMWDTPHWLADISKTEKVLNWKPKFSIEKGLEATYNWNIKK